MIARFTLLGLATAITLTGVVFLGVALFYWLSTSMVPAAAAALTALIFFVIAGIGFAIFYAARPIAVPMAQGLVSAKPAADESLVPALTALAKDHPLLAVGCATALGLADALHKRPVR